MNWDNCGEYLDRIIRIVGLTTLREFHTNSELSSSLVLLCFENCETNKEDIRKFYGTITPLHPLAIVVAGSCAAVYFDELLSYLNNRNEELHIMTGINESLNVVDWKDEFLHACWPTEERFDCWKYYSVIAIGDKAFQESIYCAFTLHGC